MRTKIFPLAAVALLAFAGPLFAAQLDFDFSDAPTNQPPPGCISLVGGQGPPGIWKVIQDEYPLALAPLTPGVSGTAPKKVVAQLSWNATDERFPMLELCTNSFGDFTFTTHFKIADGLTEQMAGVAFRIQNVDNYYYVRASALSDTFYFYTVEKGRRSNPIGNQMKITKGVWHDLSIQCEGPNIHIKLDGQDALPMLTDKVFSAGRIAFWTKSDSISYFADARIVYKPREPFAQTMINEVMKENPHLVGLEVLTLPPQATASRLIASSNKQEIGQAGEPTDVDCIHRGVDYYRKDKKSVYVTMPLRDRNGDPLGAVRIILKREPLQSEDNALARATPIIKEMQLRAESVDRLD
jgi:hypothetical protein